MLTWWYESTDVASTLLLAQILLEICRSLLDLVKLVLLNLLGDFMVVSVFVRSFLGWEIVELVVALVLVNTLGDQVVVVTF